jgi:hypothetical protein
MGVKSTTKPRRELIGELAARRIHMECLLRKALNSTPDVKYLPQICGGPMSKDPVPGYGPFSVRVR